MQVQSVIVIKASGTPENFVLAPDAGLPSTQLYTGASKLKEFAGARS